MAERRILNSWKEIAGYLGRGVRTVQRWEAQLGLPVHRPAGKDHSAVLAFSSELDEWLDSRPVRHGLEANLEGVLASDTSLEQLQSFLIKAEAMLQKLDTLLQRSDDMQRKLSETFDILAADNQNVRELRSQRARRAEAGAA